MVGGHMRTPVLRAKRVVMLAPAHEGGPKSLAEFDPLHAGDAERDAGDAVLHAVEHGVAKACGDVVCHTFNHGTQAVELGFCPENGLVHAPCDRGVDAGQRVCGYGVKLRFVELHGVEGLVGNGLGAELRDVRGDFDSPCLEGLQGDPARDTQWCGEAAREVASAGHVPMLAVFDGGGPIGMARAGDAAELAIVGASHVAVTNDGGDGRAVRVALRDAGDEFDRVRLSTGGRGVRDAGCAPVEERLEAVKVDGDTRGQAVDRAADGGGVRLPKDGDA